jgi:hypothetical protein
MPWVNISLAGGTLTSSGVERIVGRMLVVIAGAVVATVLTARQGQKAPGVLSAIVTVLGLLAVGLTIREVLTVMEFDGASVAFGLWLALLGALAVAAAGPWAIVLAMSRREPKEPVQSWLAAPVPESRLGVADELSKLAELVGEGTLTDDEFALQKARLLKDRRPAAPQPPPAT